MSLITRVSGYLSLSLLVAAVGCATPGAPMPPSLQLPATINDLAAERKGTRVTLSWTEPTQTTDRQNITRPGLTRICRAVNEFPMAQCRDIVKELGPSEIVSATPAGKRPRVIFEDVVALNQIRGGYAAYAIEVLNDRGRSAGLSNQVRVPLVATLAAPADLHVDVTPEGPVLEWTSATRSDVGTGRPDEYHYRIYRRIAGQPNFALVDEVALNGPARSTPDRSFEWEKTYEYKVTPVTLHAEAGRTEEVEGEDSPVVRVNVHDTFPPAKSTGLQAVFSGVGQNPFIDLTWAPNTEADLAGYNVFRHEEGAAPVRINTDLVKAPSFRDGNVVPGHRYFYSVQAVDARGNTAEPSEEASEIVPQ